MKILIADDELIARRLLEMTLVKLGHTVLKAEDGMSALNTFKEEHPDVLISDWVMPGLNGLDLCRAIRAQKHSRYPYIIILTSITQKQKFLEGMGAGADDFLKKPFDVDELDARLRVAERIIHLNDEVTRLSAFLPICASCKSIRDDDGYWKKLETYFREHSGIAFTHGICPECSEKYFSEMDDLQK